VRFQTKYARYHGDDFLSRKPRWWGRPLRWVRSKWAALIHWLDSNGPDGPIDPPLGF